MKKLKTVTIVISAYNEEKTILRVLESLNIQQKGNYKLEKVIILCDGCTDNTAKFCREYSERNTSYEVKEYTKRKGKARRLMNLFKNLTTDVVIIFDADVMLANKFVIENLIDGFKKNNVGLVGGLNIPMPPRNYFESLIITWLEIWNDIRIDLNKGESVHNSLGCVLAIDKNVALKVSFPSITIPDDDFIFFTTLKCGYKFNFSRNAIVYYRTIDNISDFLKQHSRLYHSKKQIFDYFGDWTKNFYEVPVKLKLKHVSTSFIRSPIKTLLALLLQTLVRVDFGFQTEKYKEGFWSIAKSSKL